MSMLLFNKQQQIDFMSLFNKFLAKPKSSYTSSYSYNSFDDEYWWGEYDDIDDYWGKRQKVSKKQTKKEDTSETLLDRVYNTVNAKESRCNKRIYFYHDYINPNQYKIYYDLYDLSDYLDRKDIYTNQEHIKMLLENSKLVCAVYDDELIVANTYSELVSKITDNLLKK